MPPFKQNRFSSKSNKAKDIHYFLIFLTCSMGKYVCHHAILTRDHGYYVGARRFTTIGDVVDYFKDHPLGETFLKQEVRLDWLWFSNHHCIIRAQIIALLWPISVSTKTIDPNVFVGNQKSYIVFFIQLA